jgi:hypothetical protein
MSLPSLQELLILIIIIAVLTRTNLWESIIRGLRELRGEHVDAPPPGGARSSETDLSFRLLGLSPSANWDEIERAYRKKAKIHHPDHGGDEDTMRALNEAYSLIKKSRGR